MLICKTIKKIVKYKKIYIYCLSNIYYAVRVYVVASSVPVSTQLPQWIRCITHAV